MHRTCPLCGLVQNLEENTFWQAVKGSMSRGQESNEFDIPDDVNMLPIFVSKHVL